MNDFIVEQYFKLWIHALKQVEKDKNSPWLIVVKYYDQKF